MLASGAQYAEDLPQPAVDEPGGMMTAVLGGALLVGLLLVAILLVRKLLSVCGPHEILVFSGRKHRLPDGTVSNYKILKGGRGLRIPFLEIVRRMDMRLFPVEVVVQNAYSSGGIPLTVRAIANVKFSSDPVAVRNAVERFLDFTPHQVSLTVQQTLEGVLREVVSQLTPEEVNEDRLKFAEKLIDNARDDFHKLGIDIDVLKVQHVADDQEYLANLGRARIAHMIRDAENAENAASQETAEAEAAAREAAQTAAKRAETRVIEAKNNAQAEIAALEAHAQAVENQADMAVETERVKAEQRLQELRAELEKLRLHCDVVLPAEAERRARELRARGEAAPAVENGKASAEALKLVSAQWAQAGASARDVFVLQQLGEMASAAAARVANAEVGDIKLVAGTDAAYATVLASHASAVGAVLRATAEAVGVDVGRLLAAPGVATEGAGDAPSPGPDGSDEERRSS
jgi:flotillin